MAPAFHIEPLDATFGATVMNVKLANLDDAMWRDLYAAWLEYALLRAIVDAGLGAGAGGAQQR